jgi:hypothetical protein
MRLAEGEAADKQVREVILTATPGRGLARSENWGLAQVLCAKATSLPLSLMMWSRHPEFLRKSPGQEPTRKNESKMLMRIYTPGGKLRVVKMSALVRSVSNWNGLPRSESTP